jgi:D-alanyl-D-alanine carboxypeptidase
MKCSVARPRTLWRTAVLLALLLVIGAAPVMVTAAPQAAHPAIDSPPPQLDPALATTLDRVLRQAAGRGSPGVALAVSVPGYQTWYGASGLANRQQALPMDPSYQFRVGSLSKMFVATVAMQLVQEGTLKLDSPISTWLPGVVPNADRMTVRHVMSHTSGLFDYLDNRFMSIVLRDRNRVWRPQELLAYAVERGPYFPPGARGRWRYSNTNYVLLGILIEKVTGNTLAKEIRQRILTPLNLSRTYFDPDERPEGLVVHGYAGASDWTSIHLSYGWGSASMVSTVDDLGRFAHALFNGQLLRQESLDRMLSFVSGQGSFGLRSLEYGLGVMRLRLAAGTRPNGQERPVSAITAIGHIGGVGGYRAAVWYLPDLDITIAAGFNEANVDPLQVPTRVLDAVLTHQGR